jgi:hypothetical protein
MTRLSEPKGKALTHISVGQRPTYGIPQKIKAEGLAHDVVGYIYPQGFQPCNFFAPFRRALPYANMRKAFSLGKRVEIILVGQLFWPMAFVDKTGAST